MTKRLVLTALFLALTAVLLVGSRFAPRGLAESLPAPAPTLTPLQCKTAVESFEKKPYPLNFDEGQCTHFAMEMRPDLEVLNFYQQTCLTAQPWNGGQWPDRIDQVVRGKETLQEAFRKDLGRDWYWTASNAPAVGATAHYGESCGTGFGATGHVAYVAGFDAKTLTLLHDNFPTGSMLGTQGKYDSLARRDCIRYILPLEIRNRAPELKEQSFVARFSSTWPVRLLRVDLPYAFDLRLDGKQEPVLSSPGGARRVVEGKVYVLPGAHTVNIRFWAPAGVLPTFYQAAWLPGDVLADEAPPDVPLPIRFSFAPNPALIQAGDALRVAVTASEPTTHRPVTAIEAYLDGQLAGRNNGSASVFVWGPGQLTAGVHRFTLMASLGDSTRTAQATYALQVYPKGSSARNPGEFIGFALPLARAERANSAVPVSFSIAQAALESSWGASDLATRLNNFFNIRCDSASGSVCADLNGARWRSYASAGDAFADHGRLLRQNPGYQQAFGSAGDTLAFSRAIARAGFGANSGDAYAQQITRIIADYGLMAYDGDGALLGVPTPAATPARAATPAPPAPPTAAPTAVQAGRLVLISDLTMSGDPRASQAAGLSYRVRNVGGQSLAGELGLQGALGEVNCLSPWRQPVSLQPGQEASYENRCQISFSGSYVLTAAFVDAAGMHEITWPDGSQSPVRITPAPATATPRPPTATPVPPTPTPRPTSPPAPVSGTYAVVVPATIAWQNTGVAVSAGSRLTIDYVSGRWSPWPGETFDANGTLRSCASETTAGSIIAGVCHFSLIGRIGSGDPFYVGSHLSIIAPASGTLFLGPNDRFLSDNSGAINVSVTVGSQAPAPQPTSPPAAPTAAPAPSFGQLVISQGFTFAQVPMGQSKYMRFAVRNAGGQTLTTKVAVVSSPSDRLMCPWEQTVTLQPGQESSFSIECFFGYAGQPTYRVYAMWRDGVGFWTELKWPDGRSEYFTAP